MAQFQTEIDELRGREEMNASYNHFQQDTRSPSTKSLAFSDVYESEKRRYSLTTTDPESFDKFEKGTGTDTETEMKIDPVIAEYKDVDDNVTQVLQFGFEEQMLLKAMDNVKNKDVDDPHAIYEQWENYDHKQEARHASNAIMRPA